MFDEVGRSRQGSQAISVGETSDQSSRRLTLRSLFTAAATFLLFLAVVIPNSLQLPTAIMLVACFVLSLRDMRVTGGLRTVSFFYACSAIVTVFFLAVGLLNNAPLIAVPQVLVIYIVSPILWIAIAAQLTNQIGVNQLVQWFVRLAFLCCLSIAIYFYLFSIGGASAVSFFIDDGNLNLKDGYAGATMHVYGSLIFLCGGFFSSPELVRGRAARLLLLGALLASALTSGRAALILSVPIGLLIGVLLTPRAVGRRLRGSMLSKSLRYGLPLILAFLSIIVAITHFTEINLSMIISGVIEKIGRGGGDDRTGQAAALYDGILNSGGMGVGHGVGVSFVRSAEYPWRYELLWLATILRVGLLGSIIYGSVFFVYIAKVLKLALHKRLTPGMKFMFGGFICVFVASNTNPYIEGFVFQWMYILPVVSFFVEYSLARRSAAADAFGSVG